MTNIEQIIDDILEDMGERPFVRTWEGEERNMRKILKKHLTSKAPTAEDDMRHETFYIGDTEVTGYNMTVKKKLRLQGQADYGCPICGKEQSIGGFCSNCGL